MPVSKFTEFGIAVKIALTRMGLDQQWLIQQVKCQTGLFIDGGYLYKIMTGKRHAPKITAAIREILELPESMHTVDDLLQEEDGGENKDG